MNGAAAGPGSDVQPGWLPAVLLGLLVLPFDPYWIDFEQVRRGLLLLLTGLTLLCLPRLPRVRGEAMLLAFLAYLGLCALINVRSLQGAEALYRLAHGCALLVVLRVGAAVPKGLATPIAAILLLTSLFGLLQRAGLAEIAGFGVEREPVSVFGNLNVASEWTAVAAAAVAVLGTPRPWLGRAALVLAAAYLAVNQSRSGLIALPIGLLLLLAKQRTLAGALPLLLALAGGGLGCLAGNVLPRPAPVDQQAVEAEHRRGTATLDVRRYIAVSSTQLFAERPLFGWGPGQFAVQYPRVRSQEEIDLSSGHRQFATEVRTAHDDWLELLVEGGLPALLLFAGALFALQRGTPDKTRLVPLFVLLLLMFVRAPLGNAPAIAAALLLVGAPVAKRTRPQPWALWATRALGLGLAVLGLLPVVAHQLFTPYQAAARHGEQRPVTAVLRAIDWMWWEPRWLQIAAQEHIIQGNLAAARSAAARASQLRPHDPELYKLVGEVLSLGGALPEAEQVARHALQIDPGHPELRVLHSAVLLQQRRYDEAIAAVVIDPHPVLRTQLLSHFRSLTALAEQRGDAQGAARCAVERDFLLVVEALGNKSPGGHTLTAQRCQALLQSMRDAGTLRTDLRGFVASALQFHDLGLPDDARLLAADAQKTGKTMPKWQQDLLGDKLQPLREQEPWFAVLRR